MFTIKFKTGNSAFAEYPAEEIETILQKIIIRVKFGDREGNILDTNGNNIGKWKFKEE